MALRRPSRRRTCSQCRQSGQKLGHGEGSYACGSAGGSGAASAPPGGAGSAARRGAGWRSCTAASPAAGTPATGRGGPARPAVGRTDKRTCHIIAGAAMRRSLRQAAYATHLQVPSADARDGRGPLGADKTVHQLAHSGRGHGCFQGLVALALRHCSCRIGCWTPAHAFWGCSRDRSTPSSISLTADSPALPAPAFA